MPRGLQLAFIAIGLVIIGALLFYIWRQSKRLNQQRLAQKKTEELQAQRRDKMVESIRIIALAVEEKQIEYSEACLRLKGLLDYVDPSLLNKTPFEVFQTVYDKIQHMPTHEARKNTDSRTIRKLDKERLAVEQTHATEIREAASALKHHRFDV